MADDELPPDGLFYESDGDDPPEDYDAPLGSGDLAFSDDEIAAIKRLSVVRDPDGQLPRDGAEILAFRNSDHEVVVVPTAVATEAERALRAYNLHLDGMDWNTIAAQEKYPSALAARSDIDRYLSEGRAMIVEKSAKEMLELEMARLNRYTYNLKDGISKGQIAAITEARHLVMSRARLAMALGAGLSTVDGPGRTVVIAAGDDSFLATLKEAAGGKPSVSPPPDEGP